MNTKEPNDSNTRKKTSEGFAEKVERLSREPDGATADNDFQPVMTTSSEHTEAPLETHIIKKHSIAGWLGFLFGATALAGLGYWYQRQNGWQWPPETMTQARQSNLRTLEERLASLRQEADALARQAAENAIAPLKEQLDAIQAQLAEHPGNTSLSTGVLPGQITALQQQQQQLQAQIDELQNALAQTREDTRQQLLQWQQRLEEQAANLPPAAPADTQAAQKLATQLRLQQALNAVETAQLALHTLRRPQGAIQALQQAAAGLEAIPDAQDIARDIKQAREQLSIQPPDTITSALADIMRDISRWRWQPEKTAPASKKNWLEQLVVIKKIDGDNTPAMTLAEEELLKNNVLDALAAAGLAYRNSDQPAWQQALKRAITTLSSHTQNQAPLAEAVGRLKKLQQHDITPDWPNLAAIAERLRQHLNATEAAAKEQSSP